MVTSPTLFPQVNLYFVFNKNLSLMLFLLGIWLMKLCCFFCELFVFCSLRNVNYFPLPITVQPTCQNITKRGVWMFKSSR